MALQHLVAAAVEVTRAMCPRLCKCDNTSFAQGVRLAHLPVRGRDVVLLVMGPTALQLLTDMAEILTNAQQFVLDMCCAVHSALPDMIGARRVGSRGVS